jgi:hypothetical protein
MCPEQGERSCPSFSTRAWWSGLKIEDEVVYLSDRQARCSVDLVLWTPFLSYGASMIEVITDYAYEEMKSSTCYRHGGFGKMKTRGYLSNPGEMTKQRSTAPVSNVSCTSGGFHQDTGQMVSLKPQMILH